MSKVTKSNNFNNQLKELYEEVSKLHAIETMFHKLINPELCEQIEKHEIITVCEIIDLNLAKVRKKIAQMIKD